MKLLQRRAHSPRPRGTRRAGKQRPVRLAATATFCTWRPTNLIRDRNWRVDYEPWPPCHHTTASSRVIALPSCRYGPEPPSVGTGGRFGALGLLGCVVGDEGRSPSGGSRAGGKGGVIPRIRRSRRLGLEQRRRVEEQEEEQGHRKDPGFARPIILASVNSSRFGALCEHFARISYSRLGKGGREYRVRPMSGAIPVVLACRP
jgi:hypothetical protein